MTNLRRPPRRYEYVDSGPAIYVDSFATIRREADLRAVPADADKLAVRMIHGSGQVDLADDLIVHPLMVSTARSALEAGGLELSRGRLAGLWFLRASARRMKSGAARQVDLTFRARVDLN